MLLVDREVVLPLPVITMSAVHDAYVVPRRLQVSVIVTTAELIGVVCVATY